MPLLKKALAEFVGTLVLVVIGCGVAIVTSSSQLGGNTAAYVIATALAFGLSIIAIAYSIGTLSGCHINPAVSLGVLIYNKITGKKGFGWKEFGVYVVAQISGALVGALLLELIFMKSGIVNLGLGSNEVQGYLTGFNQSSINLQSLLLGLLVETLLTFVFVLAIIGVCSRKEFGPQGGVVIGLTLTLVHLLGIELTGTSVNPARSIGPALIAMLNGVYEPSRELWIFIVGPLLGAALAALVFAYLEREKAAKVGAKA
jgi:aquaporin Z